jgi:serine protease Do
MLLPAQTQPERRPSSALAGFSDAITGLAASASPAVVQITLRVRVPMDSGDKRRAGFVAEQRASGSGVIIDPAGFIVTNAHVIEGAQKIDVSVLDPGQSGPKGRHRHYSAKVAGTDKETDLAVLKIDASNLPVIPFYNSDDLKQGQVVLALGSPLGLENSLTVGFISAPHRHLNQQEPMYYIQTDAAINPGNSGGPLLDIAGRIVGINTLILSRSGGSEGIGFAIPSNTVKRVCQQLRTEGRIRRGALGVLGEDITPVLAGALGLNQEEGVILSDVAPHSAAEAAGLQPGDIVLALDGQPVNAVHELIGTIFEHRVGDTVVLDVQRAGERMKKTVTVMERPNSPAGLADLASHDARLVRELGILALTVDERVTSILSDLRRLYGVAVAAIPAEFLASNPGLAAGDVIYEMNGKRIASLQALMTELASRKTGDPVALLVERDGRLIFVSFELE